MPIGYNWINCYDIEVGGEFNQVFSASELWKSVMAFINGVNPSLLHIFKMEDPHLWTIWSSSGVSPELI